MKTSLSLIAFLLTVLTLSLPISAGDPAKTTSPRIVGHRGFMLHAPENTLAGFAACIELRLGLELDIRRTRDGVLVCMHDPEVKRTTNGKGKVSDLSLAELRRLDAGAWFDPAFTGQRVPTLEEVFALLKSRGLVFILVALDFKEDDPTMEADVVRLANKYGVLSQVICIGRAITEASVRRKLRAADAATPVAVLAQTAADLQQALAAADADWIYLRFVPTAEQAAMIHGAKKRIFLSGTKVSGNEPDNWRAAQAAGVDALLTDYPLECRKALGKR